MSFKKYYKSANDKLCADHMIIDEIFEKAHNKTKSIYVYRPVFAAVAAVLVFVSIYAMNNKPHTNTPDNAVVYNKSVSKAEHNPSDQSVNENESKVLDTDSAGNMTITKGRGSIYDVADDSLPKEEFEAASSGGGMNITVMKAYKESFSEEYISQKEYFEYLGFEFNEDTVLSNGMKIHRPENYRIVKDKEGNITEDSSAFTISCENRLDVAAMLTVGKINPPEFSQDKCEIIADTNVFITQTYENSSADFTIGNSWCSLVSTGLNQEEFTVLLSEILANKICQ